MLGPHHGIAALFTLGYALGSPDVAPMLPKQAEVAFTKLNKEMGDTGLKLYESGAKIWETTIQITGAVSEKAQQKIGQAQS